jgi:hypothetical protein
VWRKPDDGRELPEFTVAATESGRLPISWWFDPGERWRGSVPVVTVRIGAREAGCVGMVAGSTADDLAQRVSEFTSALVHGQVVLTAYRPEPWEYEPPPSEDALSVWASYSYRNGDGSGSSATKTYLDDPDTFETLTGVRITEDLGVSHQLSAYAPEIDEGDRGDLSLRATPGAVALEVRIEGDTET